MINAFRARTFGLARTRRADDLLHLSDDSPWGGLSHREHSEQVHTVTSAPSRCPAAWPPGTISARPPTGC